MIKLSFLFDNYGLYPLEIIDNTFIIDDFLYKVEEIKNYAEEDIININNFSKAINMLYKNSFHLIKNRKGNYITSIIDKNYVLVSTKIDKINYYDILKFTKYFINKNNEKYNISEMIKIWNERFENIKKSCFNSIDSNDVNFDKIHTAVSFSFGLAENAISYLADSKIDYGDNIERLSLSHVRLNSYDSYSFFNPFNMIIDTIIRDYAELYKFELIDIYDLDKIISNLNINVKEASLLMARILYPTRIFDLLEDNYLNEDHKVNKTIEYMNTLDKELQRIKNVHSLLKRKYNIRPIEWLKK